MVTMLHRGVLAKVPTIGFELKLSTVFVKDFGSGKGKNVNLNIPVLFEIMSALVLRETRWILLLAFVDWNVRRKSVRRKLDSPDQVENVA